ncbi:MAG: amino acid adenylation domain-containing protein, partial [Cytophagales bacterium]|nr:amino acid adenylation domain-containing protein [Cytophagales bacterium]
RDQGIEFPEVYGIEVFEKPNYDLTIRVHPAEALTLYLDYNDEVYDPQFMERLKAQWQVLTRSVLEAPEADLRTVTAVPEEEEKRLVAFGTGPLQPVPYPTLVAQFEAQAARTPDAVAVLCGDRAVTFAQLNARANALAHHLKAGFGVAPGQPVGLLLERSERLVIAVLGILKAGGAFLPVDAALPQDRKTFMLTDAGVRLVLTESDRLLSLSEGYDGEVMALDLYDFAGEAGNPPAAADPGQLLYVIYTSGSTGQPKGVQVQHDNFVHYINWANAGYFNDEPHHTFGLFTSLSFDLSLTALFSGLLRGGTLLVCEAHHAADQALTELFAARKEVNAVKLTPSHVSLLGRLPLTQTHVQTVILGGEAVRSEHVSILRKLNPAIRIFNEYGPTETTVGSTVLEITGSEDPGLIGRPIANETVYVLNEALRMQPTGAPGEIYIGGAGVARGYLNRPELTAQRFIDSPFRAGERLYRTGDLGRWQAGGQLEYCGRIDEQVKVRGYRVEPGEVENAARRHPAVTGCVVVAVADAEGNAELAGYYTSDREVSPASLRGHLAALLPEFMVPPYLVPLPSLPLNLNGKVDRQRLPDPRQTALARESEFVAPAGETEAALQRIWTEVLEREGIGVHD